MLILADRIGWRDSYLLMALLMLVAMIPTCVGPEPEVQVVPPRTLREAVVTPLLELLVRRGALWLLLLVVLYKFGNWFSGQLTNAFLIEGLHFTATDVGVVNKGFGIAATHRGHLPGGCIDDALVAVPGFAVFRHPAGGLDPDVYGVVAGGP